MKLTLSTVKSLIKRLKIYNGKYYLAEEINSILFAKKEKKVKTPYTNLKEKCDDLWREIIKLKAGYCSEISGKEGKQIGGEDVIAAHHIAGKKSLYLRYLIENGICLINGSEHLYGIHSRNIIKANKYKDMIEEVKGVGIYERLASYSNRKSKSLKEIEIYLEYELSKLKRS